MAITPLDLAAIVWKDCRSHLLQNGDIRDAAETVVATLMETYDEEEIGIVVQFGKNHMGGLSDGKLMVFG